MRTNALFLLFLFFTLTSFQHNGKLIFVTAEEVLQLHPFNEEGNHDRMFIRYSNHRIGDLSIRILNLDGETVKEYMDLEVPKGFHTALLDLSEMETGKYHIRLTLKDDAGQMYLSEGVFYVDNE